jgi:hypothetical protein
MLGKFIERKKEELEEITLQPRNRSWITKVCISSSRTEEIQKISPHPQDGHEFLEFPMHVNILHSFFALNRRF